MRTYTLPEAKFILSHVFCVHHVPEDEGSLTYPWSPMFGEALCVRCTCRTTADLRFYIASTRRAQAWLELENAAVVASWADRS